MQASMRTPALSIPEAPVIEGLRFRPIDRPGDYEPLVAVYTACADADRLPELVTIADFANFIENPFGFDPALDVVVAEVEGHPIGYAWVGHRQEATGDEVHVHRGYIHPKWRRRGIGGAMAAFARRRAAAARLSDGPAFLQTYAFEGEHGAHVLAAHLGYGPVRYAFTMVRDLHQPIPDLTLPPGVELRTAGRTDYRRIWEAEREAFQEHWGYTPWSEENFDRFARNPHYDPALWRVAWDGDTVAGGVLNYVNHEENEIRSSRRGYTEDIFVRKPWRRRGLASALIARSLTALKDLGLDEAALGVDAENTTGALNLYTRLGYTPVQTWTFYRRPLLEAETR